LKEAALNSQEIPAFRDLTKLVTWLKITLGVYALASLADAYSSWLQIRLLQALADGVDVSDAAATANDLREVLVNLCHFVMFLATAILFLRWSYLTKKNAAALGAQGLEFSPRWSVGSYFVPIVTLWKPYQALRESFQASHPEFHDNWLNAPSPPLLPVWWTLWIINSIAGQIVLRTSLNAKSVPELLNASWINLWSCIPEVALVPVVWALVGTMQRWQSAKHRAPPDGSRLVPPALVEPPAHPARN
jgi:hypothetical protein